MLSTESRVQRGLEFADFVRRNRGGPPRELGPSLQVGPLLCALVRGRVDFVVVGSIAGLAYGSAYPTFDLDVAYARDPGNLTRLDAVLAELVAKEGPRRRTGPTLSMETPYGNLDVLEEIPGIENYDELRRDSGRERIAGVVVRIASLNHLIAMKRASNQRKDQLMAMEYVEIAELLGHQESDDS